MQTLDNSNRPFETVKPLAVELGMDPVMDERTVTNSGVFDNKFREKEHEAGSRSCVSQPLTVLLQLLMQFSQVMRCLLAAGAQARPSELCQK